ncbi:hypothetical protein POJ06DRAFT_295051 [Lipomyces tetrasporus]|uniref:Uncharacterized protein n=1 Tax=Lipomyces tetrasporus TaxID=54092 RepID=A0AAD7QTS2_9ASCO|nr:uncharacterized protein POJ06DRAFT_295051 [Lipomyces tetrasporus]KAJ8101206.1 hypothetical protein POJ06DRAFT_295051 [Lipomyces tetrasporus]
MSNAAKPLLPYSHNQSRPLDEIALSTINRKRDYPTSDSYIEPASTDADDSDCGNDSQTHHRLKGYKRMQLTSDIVNDDEWVALPSSPPKDELNRSFISTTSSRTFNGLLEPQPRLSASRTTSALSGRSSSFVIVDRPSDCASDRIRLALEDGMRSIDLDGLNLDKVPDEIGDLRNLVALELGFAGHQDAGPLRQDVEVYLSNNYISEISPSLFTVENITVLSLRNNRLSAIPNAIYRLRNLQNLSLGGNELQYLPAQILQLKQLHVLTVHPNPFRLLPDNAALRDAKSGASPYLALASSAEIESNSATARLSELCLRILSRYRATEKEISKWNLPMNILELVNLATKMNLYKNACGQCGAFMVKEVAYAYEWWNGVVGIDNLVVRRDFCSGSCVEKWNKSL